MNTLARTGTPTWVTSLATWSTVATVIALACLGALHVVSPEFSPSWRMVSEYANGRFSWLLSLFFAAWGVGTWLLAAALWPMASTTLGRVGLGFLLLAGLGELMAAAFDINHTMHGPAAMIGIPTLPVAAVLLSIAINRRGDMGTVPMWSAHMTWISVVLMATTMALFFSSLSRAGVTMSAQAAPLVSLPAGVIALVGYANRLLVVSYCLWVVLAARALGRDSS